MDPEIVREQYAAGAHAHRRHIRLSLAYWPRVDL